MLNLTSQKYALQETVNFQDYIKWYVKNNFLENLDLRFVRFWTMNNTEFGEKVNGTNIWEVQAIIMMVVGPLFSLLTVIGNLLIILAVFLMRHLRTVTNYFIVSLAVADLLVGVVVMPLATVDEVMGKWPFEVYILDLWIFINILVCTASILNLCCISLDRYLAVTRPLIYTIKKSKRLALITIAIVWLISVVIASPWFFVASDYPLFQRQNGMDKAKETRQIERYAAVKPGYTIYASVTGFFLPMTITVYVYMCVMRVIFRRESMVRRKNNENGLTLKARSNVFSEILAVNSLSVIGEVTNSIICVKETPSPNNNNHQSGDNHGHNKRINSFIDLNKCLPDLHMAHRISTNNVQTDRYERASYLREKKAATTLAVVVSVFIICWLPYFLTNIISLCCTETCHFSEYLVIFIAWLGWFNSALNPFIYAFCNRRFRAVFWLMKCGHFRRAIKTLNHRKLQRPRVKEPDVAIISTNTQISNYSSVASV